MIEDGALAERRATERHATTSTDPAEKTKDVSNPADVGAALRNAFRTAVEEDVPDELLDLLRRLD